jgi:hypothetical protein
MDERALSMVRGNAKDVTVPPEDVRNLLSLPADALWARFAPVVEALVCYTQEVLKINKPDAS